MTDDVTYAELVAWGRTHYPDIERRVVDVGWAFKVDIQPAEYLDNPHNSGDMIYGAGPLIVVKSTRKVWQFGSGPGFLPIHEATTERKFNRARRKSGFKLTAGDEIPRLSDHGQAIW